MENDVRAENPVVKPFFGRKTLIALAMAALLAASLTVAFADTLYIALPGIFLCLFYIGAMARNPWNLVAAFLLVGIPWLVTGSVLPGAILLGLYTALGAGATLTIYCKSPVFALAASALAFGLSALISGGQWERALPAVLALPAYLLTALAFARRERRSVVVLGGQIGLVAVVLGIAAFAVIRTEGAITKEVLLSLMERLRSGLLAIVKEVRDSVAATVAESGAELPEAFDRLFNDATLTETVRRVTNLLPGLAAALCGVIAFLGESLFRITLANAGDERAKEPGSILFMLGIPSAVVYLASLILTVALDSGSLVYAVSENLSIILLLPFFFEGLQHLVAFFVRLPAGARWFFLLLFLAFLCCLSAGVVEVLAFYAALETIFLPLRARIRRRRDTNGPDGN